MGGKHNSVAIIGRDGVDRWPEERWSDLEKEHGIGEHANRSAVAPSKLFRPRVTKPDDPYL